VEQTEKREGEMIGKGKWKSKDTELERYLRGRSHNFPFLMLSKNTGTAARR